MKLRWVSQVTKQGSINGEKYMVLEVNLQDGQTPVTATLQLSESDYNRVGGTKLIDTMYMFLSDSLCQPKEPNQ